MDKGIIYPDLSYSVMRAVFAVHNELGPGFLESIYEAALAYELQESGLQIARQQAIQVYYRGHIVGTHRLDLIVEGKIILELKAVADLQPIFKQQVRSYLKASGLKLGILINFGTKRIQSARIAN
ncbi:MAG: GxxExxY protein [Anaerolineaceae bacterium]|nr:GxxExxY protein [Anaerolineaceae bacterium]